MRQLTITGVLLLAAAAVGFGVGFLTFKPKLTAAREEAETMKTQMQTLETQSQAKQRAADDEIAKLRADLMRTRNELTRVNADLIKARTELAQLKASLEQPQTPSAPSAPTAAEVGKAPVPSPAVSAGSSSSPAVSAVSSKPVSGTREYVIKEGDSFWKIAATQLGSGIRYKEILQLNPTLSPDKPLEVGAKILIPAK